MLSCGGGGLSSFSNSRGFQTFAESSRFSADPRPQPQLAAKKGPPFDPKHQGRRQWRSPCDLRVSTGACSIASRRPALPCWPGRPVQPSMQLLDAKVFPALFVRPMHDWRWRTAMGKIFCPCPIRSGSRLSQKSEFSRRPAASAGDERVPPFVQFQSIKLVDIVMAYPHSRCVCPPTTMTTVSSSFASRRLPASCSPRPAPAWPARPNRARHVQKKDR